jgi:hypothetical protein
MQLEYHGLQKRLENSRRSAGPSSG